MSTLKTFVKFGNPSFIFGKLTSKKRSFIGKRVFLESNSFSCPQHPVESPLKLMMLPWVVSSILHISNETFDASISGGWRCTRRVAWA